MSKKWLMSSKDNTLITAGKRRFHFATQSNKVRQIYFCNLLSSFNIFFLLAYEEIRANNEEDSSDSDSLETVRVKNETPDRRDAANESIRSMYSSNLSSMEPKLDDIMVIDVLGDHGKEPPQSTPLKKAIPLLLSWSISLVS